MPSLPIPEKALQAVLRNQPLNEQEQQDLDNWLAADPYHRISFEELVRPDQFPDLILLIIEGMLSDPQ